MGMACVAETWEDDSKGQFREMIHDEVDKWVDQLWEEFGEDRQPNPDGAQ